jgi:MFS family permease
MKQSQIGWGDLLSGTNGIRSLALAGGVALHAINVYVATTILPSVVADIGGLDYYAWNTTLFVAASIAGAAVSAKLLQVSGPRGAYAAAACLFGLGTLVCALAPTMPVMLAGRLVQGLGGGILFALSYAMIRLVFHEALWPRAMALVSGMWGIATLVGPAIGGIFAEAGAWRWAFWSVIPVTCLFAVLALAVLPRKSRDDSGRARLALAQLVLLTLAVLAVSLGSVQPGLVWNAAGLAAALVSLALLVLIERRAGQRLLPRGALQPTAPLGLVFATMSLLTITVTGTEIFVPLFLQVLHGQSPLIAGYLAAAMGAGWTLGSIASSGAQGPGIGRAMVAAPVVAVVGMVCLALLVPAPSAGTWPQIATICLALATVGIGVGLGWPHLLTRVLQIASADEQALASASITTVQLFATAFGAALAGMVANLAGLTDPGGTTGTADAAFWLFAVFALAPALAILASARGLRDRVAGAI